METKELANRIRIHAIQMTHQSHASHVGAVLSVADIVAVLYNDVLRYDVKNPDWEDRDRVVLSKGHAGIAIYSVLAECGFFPLSELDRYYQNGSPYSGHVSHKGVPGVEISTGSLGHGVAIACGMALAGKAKEKDYQVFAIVGDGESEEGVVWETAAKTGQLYNYCGCQPYARNGRLQRYNCALSDSGQMGELWLLCGGCPGRERCRSA